MVDTRQIRSWLRIILCALLCIGATLDDIDYINAIRAPRMMGGSSVTDDDSDDQHCHFLVADTTTAMDWNAPFLSALYLVKLPKPASALFTFTVIRSGRAPPAFFA